MIDEERVLAKIEELNGYLRELRAIAPSTFEEYQRIEIKRACERLLQISIECLIDICHLIVSGLRLGLPSEEDDIFEKMAQAGLISDETKEKLKSMKGFRNILVHEYGRVDDRIVYNLVKDGITDIEEIKRKLLDILDL